MSTNTSTVAVASSTRPRAVTWIGGTEGFLRLLDQTLLPMRLDFRDCTTAEEVWEAIRSLRVRGAPAIGIAAAFGVVLGARQYSGNPRSVEQVANFLRTSRPTAVNLFWALERMERAAHGDDLQTLLDEAQRIHDEDLAMCRAIGEHGAGLIRDGMGVLTHCNAGALATADYGTALAAIFVAAEQGRHCHVYVDETRPLLQGSRLTAWELHQRGIDCTLICDNMAAQVMKENRIQLVITGADRIAANGDTANKIGTYGVAVLAKAHGIPFYVAAPSSTFDFSLTDGRWIPIEQRDPREITHGFGRQTAPDDTRVYNPAFDVTPQDLIAGLITEKGLIRPVDFETITRVLREGGAVQNS